VGIDLGTTKTAVCYRTTDGKIEPLLFSSQADDQIPSIVALEQPRTTTASSVLTPTVGQRAAAKRFQYMLDRDGLMEWNIFPRCKLSLGRGGFRQNDYPAQLLEKFPGIEPEHIAGCILAEVRRVFQKQKRQPLRQATITIPANWDPEQRRATKLAALMAGFEDVILLEEPVAAILGSVDWNEYEGKTENVVVVDFGGGTCDVAYVTIRNREIELCGIGMQNNLGGELIDELLLENFIEFVELEIQNLIGKHEQLNLRYPKRRSKAVKAEIQRLVYKIDALTKTIAEIKTKPSERAYIRFQLEKFKRKINEQLITMQEDRFAAIQENMEKTLASYNIQIAPTEHSITETISSHGELARIPYTLEYQEFVRLLNTPREELNTAREKPSLAEKQQPVSIVDSFRQLLEELRKNYIQGETISRVILVGGSSYLYFVRPIVCEVLNLSEGDEDDEKDGNDFMMDRKIEAAYEPLKAVARGATEYEYLRNQKKTNFKSRLFYDLRLQGNPPLTLLPIEQEKTKLIPPRGIEIRTPPLNMVIENSLPANEPIMIEYARGGGKVENVVRKKIEHLLPIGPKDEIEFCFKISIDGIIEIKAKNYQDDTPFRLVESYPVCAEEGLSNKIDHFRDHFPSLVLSPRGGHDE